MIEPRKISLVQFQGLDYWVDGKKAYVTFPTGPFVYSLGAKSDGRPLPAIDTVIKGFLNNHTQSLIERYGPDRVDTINGVVLILARKEPDKEPIDGGRDFITTGEKGRTDFQLCRWVEATPEREKGLVDIFGKPF